MAEASEYPKTLVRNGVERLASTPSDEVAAKFDGFTESKSKPTAYAGGDVFHQDDAS